MNPLAGYITVHLYRGPNLRGPQIENTSNSGIAEKLYC